MPWQRKWVIARWLILAITLITRLSGLGTSDKLIRDRSELVRRMLTATIKSLRFIQQRPAESMQFISKEWSVDSASANVQTRSMLPAFSKDGGMDEKGIRDALKRETERMALKEETPLSRVLDLRLLPGSVERSSNNRSRGSPPIVRSVPAVVSGRIQIAVGSFEAIETIGTQS